MTGRTLLSGCWSRTEEAGVRCRQRRAKRTFSCYDAERLLSALSGRTPEIKGRGPRFYCLEGLIDVEARQPPGKFVLRPGESCEVPPRTVHHVSNAKNGTSRYLLVQAPGQYDYVRVD
jgi:mannose-6-phosphate isomerase-like protein (cupin superfamily)